MYGSIPIENPADCNDVNPRWTLGEIFRYNDSTYGPQLLRYVKFLDAVTYVAGHVCVAASATAWSVTNDVAGGSALGTASDAAVGQRAVGIALRAMTQNYHGFVVVQGRCAVFTDDGVSQMHHLVPHNADGTADTMADGEEEQVFGYALADDNDTTHLCNAFVNCMR